VTKSLREIQAEIGTWAADQFGENPNRSAGHPGEGSPLGSIPPLLGMVEEVGELMHAYVYRLQGRGDFGDLKIYTEAMKDGLADLLVFACDFSNRVSRETGVEIQLEDVLNAVWEKVSQRRRKTWNADKAAEGSSLPSEKKGGPPTANVSRDDEGLDARPAEAPAR
jgi:NTP pyrophosphatase (non-canonical NTP hydrolase)